MGELGLLTPDNPVTSETPGEAAARAAAQASSPAPSCSGGGYVTGDLPTEASKLGLGRAQAWRAAHPITFGNLIENQFCSLTFYKDNPWVDGPNGRVLWRTAEGPLLLREEYCLRGFGAPELKAYDLAGVYVCSIFPANPDIPNPKLPPAQPGNNPSGQPFGHPDLPHGPPPRILGGPGTIAGLNIGDIGKLAQLFGGSADLAPIVAAIAALVLSAGGIQGRLDALPSGLGDVFAPGFKDLATSFDSIAPGFGTLFDQAVAGQGSAADDRLQKVVSTAVVQALTTINPAFGALAGAGVETLKSLPEHALKFIEDLVKRLLDLYRSRLEGVGDIDAGNVDQVAARLLTDAMVAGLTAQVAAIGVELLHPIKPMGISQAVGLFAQFAGFSEIIRPYIGASLKHGLGQPAEHRAAAHFRTTLPPDQLVAELAAADLIPIAKYRERLLLAGYPDPYPDVFVAHLYRALRVGELARVLDGSESDRPWIAGRLRYAGYSPTDAAKLVDGIELKTTQPGRGRLVSAALTGYAGGHLERPDLEAALGHAKLSGTHRAYYLEAADLERRSKRIEDVAGAVLTAYRTDTLSRAKTVQVLTGLGMAADEITARLVVRDLQKGAQLLKDEEKQLETEIRATKSAALKLALAQLRAGFLDPAALRAGGVGMGYTPAYLDLVTELELLKGKPKSKPGTPAIGSGALEESRTALAALVAQQVQLKQVDRVSALVSLRALGLPATIVTELIDLAEALAGPASIGGHYGLRDATKLGPLWGAVVELVVGGFQQVPQVGPLLDELLAGLKLPSRERATLLRLIQDLRDLFRKE